MRLRAIVAIGLSAAALLTVSACRVEQGAALFIGDERVSQQRVDGIIDSIPEKDRAQLGNLGQVSGGALPNITAGTLRGYVIDALAVVELGQRVVQDTDRKPNPEDAAVAEAYWTNDIIGLDAENEFVELASEAETYRQVLVADSKPAAPTDDDIDSIADQLTKLDGKARNSQVRQDMKTCLGFDATEEKCGAGAEEAGGPQIIGDMHQMRDYISKYDVNVNPRYGDSFIVIQRNAGNGLPVVITSLPS